MIRGADAARLLNDDTFRQVFDIMRQEQVKLFLNSSVEDIEAREESHRMTRVLNKFERILKNAIVEEERQNKRNKQQETSTVQATSIESAADALLAPVEPIAEEAVTEEPSQEPEINEAEVDQEAIVDDDEGEESEPEYDDSDEDEEYEDEPEQEADQAGPETFTIKVDGEQVEVTLDDLKRDYSGQAYIQKGMKQAAEAKKQAEAAYTQLGQQQQQLQNLMQNLQQEGVMAQPVPPSAQMATDDPLGYMEAKAQYDENLVKFQTQRYQIAQQQQGIKQAQEQATQAHLQEQMTELTKLIPDLGDADKAAKIKENLVKFGATVGYSKEEISQVTDARAVNTLHKAMLYDQMMAGKTKVDAKVKKSKPLIKGGAKKMPQNSAAKAAKQRRANLKKSGSLQDAAALLFNS